MIFSARSRKPCIRQTQTVPARARRRRLAGGRQATRNQRLVGRRCASWWHKVDKWRAFCKKTENQVCTCRGLPAAPSALAGICRFFRQHRQRALHQPGQVGQIAGDHHRGALAGNLAKCRHVLLGPFQRGGTVAALLFQCVRHAGNRFGIGLQAFATLPNSAAKFNRPILWRMTFWLKLLMGLLPGAFALF